MPLYIYMQMILLCTVVLALLPLHLNVCSQSHLFHLRLVLDSDKTKVMLFSNKKRLPTVLPCIMSAQHNPIEAVNTYRYLGITIDDNLCFKPHIDNLLRKLKLKLGFFFRNKACFSTSARKRLVAATFLPLLDYGDVVYMNASAHSLHLLDAVYHGALRFITNCKPLTHHCTLYSLVNWTSLSMRRSLHCYKLIYTAMLGLLPLYISTYISHKQYSYSLRSQNDITLSVPSVRTVLGKKAISYSAPSTWNTLQQELKLTSLIPITDFKLILKKLEKSPVGVCTGFI